MKDKRASYLDEIGANREAVGYDKEQDGLAHEQEVAPENNWGDDKRDEVGRAASIANRKKILAKKLMRISRELEALGQMEEVYKSGIEEILDDDDENDPMSVEMGGSKEEWLDSEGKEAANHALESPQRSENPSSSAPATMGDDEWISIGPGTFDDKRDQVGRASV